MNFQHEPTAAALSSPSLLCLSSTEEGQVERTVRRSECGWDPLFDLERRPLSPVSGDPRRGSFVRGGRGAGDVKKPHRFLQSQPTLAHAGAPTLISLVTGSTTPYRSTTRTTGARTILGSIPSPKNLKFTFSHRPPWWVRVFLMATRPTRFISLKRLIIILCVHDKSTG